VQPAVVFEHVWKKFRRGERHDSLRDLVPAMAKRLVRRSHPDELEGAQEFWAVKDVSFEVKPGEALGIIGPNGAGKSTTLKLLTKILRPTRGHCHIHGRVGALIEVAAGFHPDLTGRENIFLQGAIMGMKRVEIAGKLDEIIDFAGVSEFIDTPVKRYSSGMNARLGFSIAAHLNPEALIIDEVLSVGDMSFHEKCVKRMHHFKEQGAAIVFVSHNLQAVGALCDRVLFLKQEAVAIGPPAEVFGRYVQGLADQHDAAYAVHLASPRLTDESGTTVTRCRPGDHLTLTVTVLADVDVADLTFGFLVFRSTDRLLVYDSNFPARDLGIEKLQAGQARELKYSFRAHLTRGQYHVLCHVVHNPTQQVLGTIEPAALFSVLEQRTYGGVADLEVRLTAGGDQRSGDEQPPASAGRTPAAKDRLLAGAGR